MAGRPSVAYYRDLRVRMGAGRIRLAKIYRAVQRGLTRVDVAKKRGELGARRCKPARVGRAAAGLRIDQVVTAVEDRDVIVIEIGLQPLVDALLDPFRVEILADVLHGRRRRGDAVYLAQHAFAVQGECAAEHLLLVLKGHLIGVLRGREHRNDDASDGDGNDHANWHHDAQPRAIPMGVLPFSDAACPSRNRQSVAPWGVLPIELFRPDPRVISLRFTCLWRAQPVAEYRNSCGAVNGG